MMDFTGTNSGCISSGYKYIKIPVCGFKGKEDVVDSFSCEQSNKCLFYHTFTHTIWSSAKNNL